MYKPFTRTIVQAFHVFLAAILLAGLGPAMGPARSAQAAGDPQGAASQAFVPRLAEEDPPPIPPEQVTVAGPAEGALATSYTFTASVSPISATLPITYVWQATGLDPVTHAAVASPADTASFAWGTPGPATITVTATNAAGTATGGHALTLYAPPEAAFSAAPTAGVAPLAVAFGNASSGEYAASAWDFGDGATSTETNPAHTYAAPGVYTVTLTVSGPGGSGSEVKPGYITAYTPVQASFTVTPTAGAAPLAVQFTNTSTGDWAASLWDFGDAIASTLPSPTHTYATPGVYTVTLAASGLGGSDTVTRPGCITVYTPARADFLAAPPAGVIPLTVVFTNTSTGDFDSSLWAFGDGITSPLMSPVHTYTGAGLYTVTLTVSGLGGTGSKVVTNCVTAFPLIPIPGPYRTDIALANLGPRAAAVSVEYQTAGEAQRVDLGPRLPPRATRRVRYADLAPGTAEAWAGSALVRSSQPLAALVPMAWDDPLGPRMAAAYAADAAPGTAAYLPWLTAGPGHLSRLVVQNLEADGAQVLIHLYDRSGAEECVHLATVPPGTAQTFSLLDLDPDFTASGGQGTAIVTADRHIAVVAQVHTYTTAEAYAGTAAGATTLWAPGAVRRANPDGSWDTSELVLQNAGTEPASVHVACLNRDGTLAHALDGTIAPRGGAAYSTRDLGALGDDWRGTVQVVSTNGQPLVGVCLGAAPGEGVADDLAYRTLPAGTVGQALAFPTVYREGGRWSCAEVANASGTVGTVAVEFYGESGRVGGTYTVAIPAYGLVRLSLQDGLDLPQAALEALGTSFVGAMYVTPSPGLALVGANAVYWPGEGRAAGYAAFPAP